MKASQRAALHFVMMESTVFKKKTNDFDACFFSWSLLEVLFLWSETWNCRQTGYIGYNFRVKMKYSYAKKDYNLKHIIY